MYLASVLALMYLIPIVLFAYLTVGLVVMQLVLKNINTENMTEKEHYFSEGAVIIWPLVLLSKMFSPVADRLAYEPMENIVN